MIYTVTLNPSIDYIVKLKELQIGSVNRTTEEYVYPGGKGINVSLILKELGYKSIALGFISGFTGTYIDICLKEKGLETNFINIENGFSRINMKIKSNKETEINGQGPCIEKQDIESFLKEIDEIKDGDILVLAGSIPAKLGEDFYKNIIKRLSNKNIKIIVDATKDLLLNVLEYKPFLIKPNNHELEEIFNVKLRSKEEIAFYAKKLREKGARNVLVSMGKDGALIVTENDEIFTSNVPGGTVKNSVGAGDSMVAGFIAGYIKSNDFKEALKLGAASGSATAFCYDLATKEDIKKLQDEIFIIKQ